MLIERNAFSQDNATYVAKLREKCLGCDDCAGPCRMLVELRELPEILIRQAEAHP